MRARILPLRERPDLIAVAPAGAFLWTRGGDGVAAWGEARRIDPGTGPERFERAARELAAFFGSLDVEGPGHPVAVGSFTFDPRSEGSFVVVPEIAVVSRGGEAAAIVVGEAEVPDLDLQPVTRGPEKVRYAGSTVSELDWLEAVATATTTIEEGELDKVVLARDLLVRADGDIDLARLAARLAVRFPECFTFVAEGLVGATPELLVRTEERSVESLVLAGSAPRGPGGEDERLGRALLDSEKDASEHAIAVESVRAVLSPITKELFVDETPRLLKLANVQHLATPIRGTLAEDRSALEIAGLLHPTAAVCGTPRRAAFDFIRRQEGMDRGRYAGPVGWVDAGGDGEWGIALRCAQLDGARGRLFAGAGLVEGSLPERELEETRVKLRAMQSVLGD